jgi:hypothetical protein
MKICVLALAMAGLTVVACSSPCDDLKKQCDECKSSFGKPACETIVKGDNGDACKAAIDAKQYEKDAIACKDAMTTASAATVGAGGSTSNGAGGS